MANTVRNALKTAAKRILLAWERLVSGVSYDLTSSAFIEDPCRTYEQLRRKDPVHRMRLIEAWALTSLAPGLPRREKSPPPALLPNGIGPVGKLTVS